MAHKHSSSTDSSIYEIRLQGHLDHNWAEWFGSLSISWDEDGETVLTSAVIDQAALYALLKKARDLGMPLIAVKRLRDVD